MNNAREKSANEIEALVLKAARGGGLPLGLAEDLAAATAFLDLGKLTQCPCHEGGAATIIPTALDRVAAGDGPQTVTADAATIAAYVALAEHQCGQTLVWDTTDTGATFHRYEPVEQSAHPKVGRQRIPIALDAHLIDMASKIMVPETEASRLGGAGAGLTDND